MNSPASGAPARRPALRWRIITVLLVVALLPLGLMGVGAWVVFGGLLEDKAVELQRSVVLSHAASVESYLATQRDLMQLVAATHYRDEITAPDVLRSLLVSLNRASEESFIDLGVISDDGQHLAYVGPYDLSDRNYRDAEWFREVMASGVFISDVFLGFRQVPHFVIAIRETSRDGTWVLRATFNSHKFDDLVATGVLGKSGEAFVVNRNGLYQTTPRVGSVLDRATLPELIGHAGVLDQRVELHGIERIVVTSWINDGRWLLVVQQDAEEVREPVRGAFVTGAFGTTLAVLLVVLTTVLATHHLSRQIDSANQQREEMFSAFMRSAKLASVGELATGLAHEINNPLAIISAEQTNITDLLGEAGLEGQIRQEISESSSRIQTQVGRCAEITAKMLQFGRKQETALELTELAPRLWEISNLLERQAGVRNVELKLDVEENLPRVLIDPLELEQVLVNLITNSFHAMPEGGTIHVSARHREDHVEIEVVDSGKGMAPEIRNRIFEPFYTTKEAGVGTGLGLSVCYGLVHSWGGSIEAESEPGRGTTIQIRLQQPGKKGTERP